MQPKYIGVVLWEEGSTGGSTEASTSSHASHQERGRGEGCKLSVRLIVEVEGVGSTVVEGVFHRRGCMRARQDHLDLPPLGAAEALWELSAPQGMRLTCYEEGGCVVLVEELSGFRARICLAEGGELVCRNRLAYLMRTRVGFLYVGGVGVKST